MKKHEFVAEFATYGRMYLDFLGKKESEVQSSIEKLQSKQSTVTGNADEPQDMFTEARVDRLVQVNDHATQGDFDRDAPAADSYNPNVDDPNDYIDVDNWIEKEMHE